MKKSAKIILIVVILLVITVVTIIVLKKRKQKEQADAAAEVKEASSSAPSSTSKPKPNLDDALTRLFKSLPVGTYPIVVGSKGQNVFLVQKMLKEKHGEPITIDGVFGPKSKATFDKYYHAQEITLVNFKALMYAYYHWIQENKKINNSTSLFFAALNK